LVDRQLNISKSVTNIIKKLMIRELALICTAQKKIDGKIVLKKTPLYDCIIGKKMQFFCILLLIVIILCQYRDKEFYT